MNLVKALPVAKEPYYKRLMHITCYNLAREKKPSGLGPGQNWVNIVFNNFLAGKTCESCDQLFKCHCGKLTKVHYDGLSRGLCEHCDSVRCDAYPGACS